MAGYDVANAPDNVFLAELTDMNGTRVDLMFKEPEAATNQPTMVDHFLAAVPTAAPTTSVSTGVTAPITTIPPTVYLTTGTVLINHSLGCHEGRTAEELHTS
jgi:hypothetical protein